MIKVNNNNFKKEVLESPQAVLVNFWAPWCGLCFMLNPILAQLESQCSEHLKIVSINADDNFQLARNYQLQNLPTLILINSGQIIHRFEGFQSREDIYTKINHNMFNLLSKSSAQT